MFMINLLFCNFINWDVFPLPLPLLPPLPLKHAFKAEFPIACLRHHSMCSLLLSISQKAFPITQMKWKINLLPLAPCQKSMAIFNVHHIFTLFLIFFSQTSWYFPLELPT